MKARAREEVQRGLDSETRQIISENLQMADELRFQEETTKELQEENSKLEEIVDKLKKEMTLKRDREKVFAHQSFKKTKEIKGLQVYLWIVKCE